MWRFLGKFIAQSIDRTTGVSRKWTRTPISGILKCSHSLIYSKTYFKTISTCEHVYGLRDQSALENHRTGTSSYLIIVHSSFRYPLTGLSSVRCVKGTFHPCSDMKPENVLVTHPATWWSCVTSATRPAPLPRPAARQAARAAGRAVPSTPTSSPPAGTGVLSCCWAANAARWGWISCSQCPILNYQCKYMVNYPPRMKRKKYVQNSKSATISVEAKKVSSQWPMEMMVQLTYPKIFLWYVHKIYPPTAAFIAKYYPGQVAPRTLSFEK